MSRRVFLLSPASASGQRARLILRKQADFPLAQALRAAGGAPLGEVFRFLSGLYFRGKLDYARAFAAPPASVPGVHVITPTRGLLPPERAIGVAELREFAKVDLASGDPRYAKPLVRDASNLERALGPDCEVVLLGSIATGKYVDLLGEVFGARLRFPSDFVGRGDMSRGGLLLRCVREQRELDYVAVAGAVRHGARPPRL